MNISFLGLGNMGSGMAGSLLRAGHALTVWNRTLAKAEPLGAAGARVAASVKSAVADADLVITSLMDDASELALAKNELLGAMRPGAIHLCATTISPACADQLAALHAAAGTRYVSGPVIGRPDAAAAGSLATYLGGEEQAIAAVTPVCAAYAKMVVPVSGRPSVANSLKLCVNYAAIATIELIGETYAFAEKCGVDPAPLVQFFQMSYAHPALKMYADKLYRRDFKGDVGFAIAAGLKDVRLMLDSAKVAGARLEIGAIVERKMVAALDSDLAQADWCAIAEVTRREAGLAN